MKISILKLSFSISLLGILLLLFLSTFPPQNPTSISNITNTHLNKYIKIQGKITNIRTYNSSNFQILTIKDSTGKIDITLNKPNHQFSKNQNLTIIGKVQQYKNSLQIQAEKIIS